MVATTLMLLAGGSLIGFLLAVLGAGGSILLLPLLVGVADLPTDPAIALSLLIVMLLAIGNAIPYLKRGQFALKPALVLGIPALAGSWIGGTLAKHDLVSDTAQLLIFVAAALVASVLMLRKGQPPTLSGLPLTAALIKPRSPLPLAGQGVLVGLLTGIAGVGGGFAIVPALVLLAGLPMQLASGTSLLLIAINSLVALIAVGDWPAAQLPMALPIVMGGVAGALIGQRLAPHLSERQLRRGFAALLIGSALLTAAEAQQRQGQTQGPNRHHQSLRKTDHDGQHNSQPLCGGQHNTLV